jgi:CspA family cold shock protein
MAMAGDQLIKCSECGTVCVWTAGEQAAGSKPELCPMCRRLAPTAGQRRGVLKWFSRAKGYGFITPVEGPEIFVHKSGLVEGQPLPRAGQLVEFTLAHGPRGAQAEQLVVLDAPVDSSG